MVGLPWNPSFYSLKLSGKPVGRSPIANLCFIGPGEIARTVSGFLVGLVNIR